MTIFCCWWPSPTNLCLFNKNTLHYFEHHRDCCGFSHGISHSPSFPKATVSLWMTPGIHLVKASLPSLSNLHPKQRIKSSYWKLLLKNMPQKLCWRNTTICWRTIIFSVPASTATTVRIRLIKEIFNRKKQLEQL